MKIIQNDIRNQIKLNIFKYDLITISVEIKSYNITSTFVIHSHTSQGHPI
jgi:hypothetical protein